VSLTEDIIETVNEKYLWKGVISPQEAVHLQRQMAGRVIKRGEVSTAAYIAGIDIAIWEKSNSARAAIVVLKYPQLQIAEIQIAYGEITFPYIPGLLSFREIPLILEAWQKLALSPDIIMVDGQGYAHPRRIGLASHLGLVLDIPTIGCAKSRLCGDYQMPSEEAGCYSNITDNGEIIGAVLRTKTGVKPVFISVGHKISLENAIYWVRECCRGYRLPQPTRLAHLAAGGNL
jgi:deoxyribonuclease V